MDILTVTLSEGEAEVMGDGLFIILQEDEREGIVHHVALTKADLEAMLALT